jgi:NDP-sugar pyrophosphorylase family protein
MVPVANLPVIHYQILLLERAGFDRVFVPLGYLGDQIESYLNSLDVSIAFEFTYENIPLGTAGAVGRLSKELTGPFLVISGDILGNVDLKEMVEFHTRTGASVSIALTRVEDPTHYGVALLEGDKILQFAEKPDPSQVFSDIANAGIYVLDPRAAERIPPGVSYDFSVDLFPAVMEDDLVCGYLLEGYWNDIGRPSRYLQANGDALTGRFPIHSLVKNFELIRGGSPVVGKRSKIGKVDISCPVVLGENSAIEEGSVLRSFVVLGDHVSIGEGTTLDGVVVHEGAKIGSDSALRKCVVGSRCQIDSDVELAEGTVIGDDTRIGQGCRIGSNMKIMTRSTLGPNTVIIPD